MSDSELEQGKRAANETLVIAPTEGGFRVYNPANITRIYMVSGIPGMPKCNCPDFEAHQNDPEWRCRHILAVVNQMEKRQGPATATDTANQKEEKKEYPKPNDSPEKKKARSVRNGAHSQMLIKRSVSPDGRIDSLSVEFSKPIDDAEPDAIKEQAQCALRLQAEIVSEFLQANGTRKPTVQTQNKGDSGAKPNDKTQSGPPQPANVGNGAVPAQLLNIAGMNTRGGWKIFINVQVNGTTTKVFGSKRELGELITAAGFASIAEHISQGMMLNLPCRVITKRSQDGKYLNIERVFPLKPLEPNGRVGT